MEKGSGGGVGMPRDAGIDQHTFVHDTSSGFPIRDL